jgi:transcription elongation factor Elf1
MNFTCPVCGFAGLTSSPKDIHGHASLEICPCCSFQFGVDDDDRHWSYDRWRATWIAEGMQWRGAQQPPADWSPRLQLAAIGRRAPFSE